jgi:hypothetical protein
MTEPFFLKSNDYVHLTLKLKNSFLGVKTVYDHKIDNK